MKVLSNFGLQIADFKFENRYSAYVIQKCNILFRTYLCYLLLLMLLSVNCEDQTESVTSGYLKITCAESVAPIIQNEKQEFERLYPKSKLEMEVVSTREALVKFFNGQTRLVIGSRDLNQEEKSVAKRYKIVIDSYKIAYDGVTVVVNPQNTVSRLTINDLKRLFSGEVSNWKEFGGKSLPVKVLLLGSNTGTNEYFRNRVLPGTSYSSSAYPCSTSAQIVELVSKWQGAVGYVGLNWLNSRIKALEIAQDDSSDFILPHQASVFRGEYPLKRTIYAFAVGKGINLSAGFISFITSAPGQKIILDQGLVPATMPVKIVKLNTPEAK